MKKTILTILLISFALIGKAQFHYEMPERRSTQTVKQEVKQKSNNSFDIRKMTIGGGLGLQFGDYTLINISPQVGYNFSKYINAGAGLTYTHINDKYYYGNIKYKLIENYFGMNIFGKFYPIENIVIMAQPEVGRVWKSIENTRTGAKDKKEKFVPACLVGGGLRLGPMTAMIQYDVVQNDDSPYGNKIFYSIGYSIGF